MRLPVYALLMALFLPVAAHGAEGTLPKLSVAGKHLQADGKPVTLRGVSLCSLEWHKPLEQMSRITQPPHKWKANVLRLPVQHTEWKRVGPQNYIKDYLDPAIRICNSAGVYCIIDWHVIDGWKKRSTDEELREFWSIVAPRYAKNPNILYEFYNEPTEPSKFDRENWLAWRKKAQKWVDAIRKDAPDTVILVGSPHWSQMTGFAAEDPFKGDNLAYVIHLYPTWNKGDWDKLFGKASEKVPLFMTEWGWSSRTKSKKDVIYGTQAAFGEPLKKYLSERPHINWTAWSYDPLCGPAMLGQDTDMADFVEQWLDEAKGK